MKRITVDQAIQLLNSKSIIMAYAGESDDEYAIHCNSDDPSQCSVVYNEGPVDPESNYQPAYYLYEIREMGIESFLRKCNNLWIPLEQEAPEVDLDPSDFTMLVEDCEDGEWYYIQPIDLTNAYGTYLLAITDDRTTYHWVEAGCLEEVGSYSKNCHNLKAPDGCPASVNEVTGNLPCDDCGWCPYGEPCTAVK